MADAGDVEVSKLLKEIRDKTKAILESNSNANYIVDLLELTETKREEILTALIKAIHKMFSKFLSQRTWFKKAAVETVKFEGENEQGNVGRNSEDPQELFKNWLHEKYLLAVKKLLQLLHHESQNVRELSLCALMKFVLGEAEATKKTTYYFPNTLFRKLCDALVDYNYDMRVIINRFGDYMDYSDVVYYLLKNIARLLQEVGPASGRYLGENIFAMLSQVKMKQPDEALDQFLVQPKAKKVAKDGKDLTTFQHEVTQVKSHRKVFSSAWLQFLRLPLKPAIHKKVLVSLHSDIMPHLVDPKLLMDFLTDSYNLGGANSLLALNGLFILIHQHNLDYPQFYNKLYALFEPSIFHIKYRSRFFSLADLFLSSTHLPAYLVAAFAKRLTRLMLTAPPSGAMLAIPFVCNLIKRHPSCQVLIHRKQAVKLFVNEDKQESIPDFSQGDPFIPDEPDPAKSKALESCLWELKTLQLHFYPDVSSLVEMLEKPLGKQETDISDYFDVSYEDLFDKECTRFTAKNAVLEYQPPKGILGKEFSDFWSVM